MAQSIKAAKRPLPVKTLFGDAAKTSFIQRMDLIKKAVACLQLSVVVKTTSMQLKDQTLMDVLAKVLNLGVVQMTFPKHEDLTMKVRKRQIATQQPTFRIISNRMSAFCSFSQLNSL